MLESQAEGERSFVSFVSFEHKIDGKSGEN